MKNLLGKLIFWWTNQSLAIHYVVVGGVCFLAGAILL